MSLKSLTFVVLSTIPATATAFQVEDIPCKPVETEEGSCLAFGHEVSPCPKFSPGCYQTVLEDAKKCQSLYQSGGSDAVVFQGHKFSDPVLALMIVALLVLGIGVGYLLHVLVLRMTARGVQWTSVCDRFNFFFKREGGSPPVATVGDLVDLEAETAAPPPYTASAPPSVNQ